jgi:hypothetical protein
MQTKKSDQNRSFLFNFLKHRGHSFGIAARVALIKNFLGGEGGLPALSTARQAADRNFYPGISF